MENQYTNYAFISYKREDEKWAKWLQRKLENYKLPSVIRRGSSDVPEYIRPVFRDRTDLSGGVLTERLREELMRSKYLIVICSPHATKSEWVDREVQDFMDAGRADSIIPFIVSGVPHASDPSEECFPQALLAIPAERELLGINVGEVGRSMAFVRLVATMLNVRFDTLWQRHKRRMIRKRIIVSAFAVLAVLSAILAWDYNRATYAYYADYVDRWGVPEGVVPLSKEQVLHAGRFYRFEYRRIPFGEPESYSWRVVKVSYVNSAMRPQEIFNSEWQERYPVQEIEYNKKTGDVSRINFCDVYGKVMLRHVITERNGIAASVADFIGVEEQKGSGFASAVQTQMSKGETTVAQRKSNIKRYVYIRNSSGYIVGRTNHSNNDSQLTRSMVCDADGIFACMYSLDSLGRIVSVRYLDIDSHLMRTKSGVAGREYEYDSRGVISKATYVDMSGRPVMNEQMWAVCESDTDEYGNVVEERYYDVAGNLCMNSHGMAVFRGVFNDKGFLVEERNYDANCELCLTEGFAIVRNEYDKYGNCIESSLYDTDGNRCWHKKHYSIVRLKYNKRGYCIGLTYYNPNGNPCMCEDGYAKSIMSHDDKGNLIKTSFFGFDWRPCMHKDGFSTIRWYYDESGNCTMSSYYGVDGRPCIYEGGCSSIVWVYDERGNMIEERYLDTENRMCMHNQGYAKVELKYDDFGNLIEESHFDADGNLCCGVDMFATARSKFDDRGNAVETLFFGADGRPCTVEDGTAGWRGEYDEHGNCIRVEYVGLDGGQCLDRSGCAGWTAGYDERGNATHYTFFDFDGNPCLNNDGYTSIIQEYDDRWNVVRSSTLDANGTLCVNRKEGYAVWKAKYDVRGNIIDSEYFGADGRPCECNQYGTARWTQKFDKRGNRTELAHFDVDGRPGRCNEGYSMIRWEYDDRDNCTLEEVLGADGEPVECLGHHKVVAVYNERDLAVSVIYYNAQNEAISK